MEGGLMRGQCCHPPCSSQRFQPKCTDSLPMTLSTAGPGRGVKEGPWELAHPLQTGCRLARTRPCQELACLLEDEAVAQGSQWLEVTQWL